MKKFEKPGDSKFQTMERNQMDQTKGGGKAKANRVSYKKVGDTFTINDYQTTTV